jgi:hypothetical protein
MASVYAYGRVHKEGYAQEWTYAPPQTTARLRGTFLAFMPFNPRTEYATIANPKSNKHIEPESPGQSGRLDKKA